jgi:hypothetical protein
VAIIGHVLGPITGWQDSALAVVSHDLKPEGGLLFIEGHGSYSYEDGDMTPPRNRFLVQIPHPTFSGSATVEGVRAHYDLFRLVAGFCCESFGVPSNWPMTFRVLLQPKDVAINVQPILPGALHA